MDKWDKWVFDVFGDITNTDLKKILKMLYENGYLTEQELCKYMSIDTDALYSILNNNAGYLYIDQYDLGGNYGFQLSDRGKIVCSYLFNADIEKE